MSELSDAGDERLKEQFVKRKYIYGRASQMRQGKKIYMNSARKYKWGRVMMVRRRQVEHGTSFRASSSEKRNAKQSC